MQGTFTEEITAINETLAEKIGPQKYRIWFKNSVRMSLAEGYLKVGVPNLFIASWIENHFTTEIDQAVKEVTGSSRKITFNIDSELAGSQKKTQLDTDAELVSKANSRVPNKRTAKNATPDLRLKLSLDNFVVGRSNQLAYNAANTIVNEERSPFNPLFIHGGYGIGKTHLLQGICNEVSIRKPKVKWAYMSAEDFVNQFVLALKTKKLEAFRCRIRQTDLLAIDDIHFLASKPSTQEEFLHTFNTIDLAGKQVVLVSDAHPKMIGQISEKLVNRFVSGMVVKIDAPDLETRLMICRQYALTMGKQIPESVIKYIAENIRTNARELKGALLKLVAFASLQNEKLSVAMSREILAEHLARTDPIVHISDIESAVATFFGLTPANIHSSKKDRTVALARHFSMYLARKLTNMSSSEVGRCMGNKNHATVLLACKKIDSQVKKNAELNWRGPTGNKIAKARAILRQLEETISG
ncbi:MAG: chromosomal replication initiator protein DnaA [Planctomycetota bacterium]|jgi:chromosomal replication initiator protein